MSSSSGSSLFGASSDDSSIHSPAARSAPRRKAAVSARKKVTVDLLSSGDEEMSVPGDNDEDSSGFDPEESLSKSNKKKAKSPTASASAIKKRKAVTTKSPSATKKRIVRVSSSSAGSSSASTKKRGVGAAGSSQTKKRTRVTNTKVDSENEGNALDIVKQTSIRLKAHSRKDAASIAQAAALKMAVKHGIVRDEAGFEHVITAAAPLPLAIIKSDMKEIQVKKHSGRKARFAFVLPGKLAIHHGGTFGSVQGLDTPSPTLNIDFPTQRIVLKGTVVYPNNQYMLLNLKDTGRAPVVCEEIMEKLVVFTEYSLVNVDVKDTKKEENVDAPEVNQDEVDWDTPAHLGIQVKVLPPAVSDTSSPKSETASTKGASIDVDASSQETAVSISSSSEAEKEEVEEVEVAPIRARSARKRRAVVYADPDDGEEEEEDEHSSGDDDDEYVG